MLLVGVEWIGMGIVNLFARRISWLRRVIFLLMSVFYSAVGFTSAFHTDLNRMVGISPSLVVTVWILIAILFALKILAGYLFSEKLAR